MPAIVCALNMLTKFCASRIASTDVDDLSKESLTLEKSFLRSSKGAIMDSSVSYCPELIYSGY